MEITLCHVESIILEVVTSHTYLSFYLLHVGSKLTFGERSLHKLVKFLAHNLDTLVHVFIVTSEVDGKGTCVRIVRERTLNGIYKSSVFTKGDVEA